MIRAGQLTRRGIRRRCAVTHNHAWPPAGLVESKPPKILIAIMDGVVEARFGEHALPASDRPWRCVAWRADSLLALCPRCLRQVALDTWRVLAGPFGSTYQAGLCECGCIVWSRPGAGPGCT